MQGVLSYKNMNKMILNKRNTGVIVSYITGIFFLGLIVGCSKAPEGFPDLVPCIVTVTDHGTPVEGVIVQIETVPQSDSLAVVAITDAQGRAVMQTQLGTFAQSGVPVGKLVMILTKVPDVPDFKSAEEREKMTYEQAMAYSNEIEARRAKIPPIIPPELNDSQHSPLTLEAVSNNSIKWNVALEDYRKK
jgi:hypothetical protein